MSDRNLSRPAPLSPVSLVGEIVRLEFLTISHYPELERVVKDERIWRYLISQAGSSVALRVYISRALQEHQRAVIGSWIAPAAWGKGVITEAKLLLLEYAFQSLQCTRVELRTDQRNTCSRAALTKLGAVEEGMLRSHEVTAHGFRRNTVVFSVIAEEWEEVQLKLRSRLKAQRGIKR
jgi:N-acetyltransferase